MLSNLSSCEHRARHIGSDFCGAWLISYEEQLPVSSGIASKKTLKGRIVNHRNTTLLENVYAFLDNAGSRTRPVMHRSLQ